MGYLLAIDSYYRDFAYKVINERSMIDNDGHFIDDPLAIVNAKPDFTGMGINPERYKTRILLMKGDEPSESMDIDRLIPNIQEGQTMRVFEKETKVIDISHTIFGRCATMQVIQVKEITADNSAQPDKQSEADFSRSIKIHNYEATINHYMEDTIDIIHRVCTSKDVKHKEAREKVIKECEDCVAFVQKEYEKGKREGYL